MSVNKRSKPKPSQSRSRIIHVRLTQEMLDTIDTLVSMGFYSSRAEFIRTAVREQLKRDAKRLGFELKGLTNSPV